MKVFTRTDIGRTRSMNQDSFLVSENKENGFKLYILADGMGGYKGGEIASRVAITAVSKFINEKFADISKDKQSILDFLKMLLHLQIQLYMKSLSKMKNCKIWERHLRCY